MIFVTVGQMHPFDRLVHSVERWAKCRGRTDLFAQVGVGGYRPSSFPSEELLTPGEFRERIGEASLVVSHAGMGTILSVMQIGTPMLVMPRLAMHHETRNDHQIASARMFRERGGLETANDERELPLRLDALETLSPTTRIGPSASDSLLMTIRSFIRGEEPGVGAREVQASRRKAA